MVARAISMATDFGPLKMLFSRSQTCHVWVQNEGQGQPKMILETKNRFHQFGISYGPLKKVKKHVNIASASVFKPYSAEVSAKKTKIHKCVFFIENVIFEIFFL